MTLENQNHPDNNEELQHENQNVYLIETQNGTLSMDEVIVVGRNPNADFGNIMNNNGQIIHDNDDNNIQDLVSCSLCNRKFLSNRLEKHLIICQKIKEKKRKLFDAAKQRAENLDKINYVPTEITIESSTLQTKNVSSKKINNNKTATIENDKRKTNNDGKKQSNWRQQHQEFIKTIRAARGATIQDQDAQQSIQDGTEESLPPGIVECPTCNRRFAAKAADRHINWCAENNKKEKERKDINENKNQEALQRMKARIKYKPVLPGNKQLSDNSKRMHRSRSISTLSTTSSTSNSSIVSNNDNQITLRKQQQIGNRRYIKTISKSSENLNVPKTNGKPIISKTNTKSPSRRTINNKNLNVNRNTNHNDDGKKMIPSSKISGSIDVQRITSKIDTGINPDRNQSRKKNTEKSAPVMKFKEKFPHHQQNNTKSIIDQFQDIEHILRRNSNAIYDNSPKTVPGVRTGGISPIKNTNPNKDNEKNSFSKSETNLQKMDNDIKKRIDQYINHLYDNEIWSNGFMTNGINNRFNGPDVGINNDHRIIGPEEKLNVHSQVIRQNSANSDEARMSTSDSTDSGLGVVFASNGNSHLLLETVNEDGKQSGKSSKSSVQTFHADVISPTMSDVETNNRFLLRNGSLNDIELMNVDNVGPNSMIDHSLLENKPKFCHQCGTKYPNVMAKFCYECGSRRFETVT